MYCCRPRVIIILLAFSAQAHGVEICGGRKTAQQRVVGRAYILRRNRALGGARIAKLILQLHRVLN